MTEHLGDLLSAYLDGEVTAEESVAVVAHLEGCVRCRHELEVTVDARRSVRSLPMMELPAGAAPPVDQSSTAPRWRSVAAVAAVAALVGAAIGLGQTETVEPDQLVTPHVELTTRVGAQGVGP